MRLERLASIQLDTGDTLLLQAHPGGIERAKKMLAVAGYVGTKVVLVQPSGIPISPPDGLTTNIAPGGTAARP